MDKQYKELLTHVINNGVDKMDRTGANFYRCVDMIIKRLGAKPLVCHLPFGEGEDFDGIIDLLEMKLVKWEGTELGAKFSYYDKNDVVEEITYPITENFINIFNPP